MTLDAERDDEAADEKKGDHTGLAKVDGGAETEEGKMEALGSVLEDDGERGESADGVEELVATALGGCGGGVSGREAVLGGVNTRR